MAREKIARVALSAAADTAGAILAWQNPTGGTIVINRLILEVTTVSSGACTADFGTTAVSATTTSDNLIDGINMATAVVAPANYYDNTVSGGTNGKGAQQLAAGKWLTGSTATGNIAGAVGYAYIHYYLQ